MKKLFCLAALLCLSGCVSTSYSAERAGSMQINARTYKVSYLGSDQKATTFLIRRASEIVLAEGGRWFAMSDIAVGGGQVTGYVSVAYYGIAFGGPTRAPIYSWSTIEILDEHLEGALDACTHMLRSDQLAEFRMTPAARVARISTCKWAPGVMSAPEED